MSKFECSDDLRDGGSVTLNLTSARHAAAIYARIRGDEGYYQHEDDVYVTVVDDAGETTKWIVNLTVERVVKAKSVTPMVGKPKVRSP